MSPGTPDLRVVFVARAEGFRTTREPADTREYRVGDRPLCKPTGHDGLLPPQPLP